MIHGTRHGGVCNLPATLGCSKQLMPAKREQTRGPSEAGSYSTAQKPQGHVFVFLGSNERNRSSLEPSLPLCEFPWGLVLSFDLPLTLTFVWEQIASYLASLGHSSWPRTDQTTQAIPSLLVVLAQVQKQNTTPIAKFYLSRRPPATQLCESRIG